MAWQGRHGGGTTKDESAKRRLLRLWPSPTGHILLPPLRPLIYNGSGLVLVLVLD